MRSRKRRKLISKFLLFAVVAACILGFFIFIYPKSNIKTYNESNNGNQIESSESSGSIIKVTLPSKIKTIDSNVATVNNNSEAISDSQSNFNNIDNSTKEEIGVESDKSYESYVDESLAPLITILSSSDNTLSILLTDKSATLLDVNSGAEIGKEYNVENITEKIVAVYDFTVGDYSYPVVLLLSKTGKVYYIDVEKGYKTGVFTVGGQIEGIPVINNIYTVTVDNQYKSAVLVDNSDTGYEFNLKMIGK